MRLLLLCLLPLAVQAAEMDDLQAINTAVNQGVRYLNYSGWDFRDVPAGGHGNCAAIAYTKWKRLAEAGIRSDILTCQLDTGDAHAFVAVGNQVLDNREPYFYPLAQSHCAGRPVYLQAPSLRRWVAEHGDGGPLPQVARAALGSGQ